MIASQPAFFMVLPNETGPDAKAINFVSGDFETIESQFEQVASVPVNDPAAMQRGLLSPKGSTNEGSPA
jgi:hypothetical protein